jgi:hypothetical protein
MAESGDSVSSLASASVFFSTWEVALEELVALLPKVTVAADLAP